jgi:signal transduction histidine kinase
LPIAHLSELKLLNSENAQTNGLDAGWRFISEPTEFTELLLDQLTNDSELKTRLLALWNQHERARLLYAALPLSPNNTGFIQKRVTVAGTNWWVLNSGNGYYGRSQEGMSQVSQDIIAMENVPEYLSLAYFSAGQLLFSGPEKGLLIASLSIDGDQSTEPERVEIYLAKPELLYARQRQRWLWLEALLGFSTIVAIAGVTHTTRSYLKQQRLNELKSNFVSSVSHELRAPLASMRLMSEGLQSGRIHDREKQREYYNYLVQECRRLSVLVENVLDFSRIDQNRKVYEFEPVDLGLVIESALKTMSPVAAERQVRLEFSTLEKCGQVRADGLALQQAIVNLLDNAIKHSPAGEKVVISLEKKQNTFEILVRDRGPGVPEAERERIFERFYRLGSELRRETPGVGIGLSIVKHIVEAHQGTVRVEAAAGLGAKFTIFIPKT